MNVSKNEQAAIFLLGTALGTSIGLILATVFKPQPLSFLQDELVTIPPLNNNSYSTLIRNVTTEWINQLRAITADLVAAGYMQKDEANKQINELLLKVRQ